MINAAFQMWVFACLAGCGILSFLCLLYWFTVAVEWLCNHIYMKGRHSAAFIAYLRNQHKKK